MKVTTSFALLALAIGALPLSAQVSTRERVRDRVIYGRTGTSSGGTVGDVIHGSGSTTTSARHSKIPPGQLPPRGMCRVWIDGVAPGQQPPVTSCAQAERDRLQYGANARVIYGDQQSFPGKGKYKNRNAQSLQQCSIWDVVVIGGQQRQVCRDANGNVVRDQNGNVISRRGDVRRGKVRGDDDENEADDANEIESSHGEGRSNAPNAMKGRGKGHGHGKHGGDE